MSKGVTLYISNNLKILQFSPVINKKVEDRICGWGPTLDFYLAHDDHLVAEKANIIKYLEINYRAASKFIEQFESIREFYAEDLKMAADQIRNERGKI